MKTIRKQRQDADRLNRLSSLEERRAFSQFRHQHDCVKSMERVVLQRRDELQRLDAQRLGLTLDSARQESMNIEWLQDSYKLDSVLLADRESMLNRLANVETDLVELRQQLQAAKCRWQKCRARASLLLERRTHVIALQMAAEERWHE